ncbi:MAG: hypothetical protein MJ135_04220 [Oscillospiraceae bacterium]|nr:hypothetical protein [Oscillospiraceae bacterium]
MKMKRILSLLLLVSMLLSLMTAAAYAEKPKAAQEPETVELHIANAEELRTFAVNCKLDAYSANMLVYLDADIDLSSHPFDPIGNFRGTFQGNGHTITGLTLSTDGSYQGLFRFIREGAVVADLNVIGTIAPTIQRENVGGIAGTNYGTIIGCTFTGEVSGSSSVGGIAGTNFGSISGCTVNGRVSGKTAIGGIAGTNSGYLSENTNNAIVNDTIPESSLTVEDLNTMDLTNLPLIAASDSEVVSDVGGIAGYSDGTVVDCINNGAIGYQSYGYNIGGIVGRQANFISRCTNNGPVLGRRDVGGIAGQMEPYLIKTQVESLVDELTALTKALNTAMSHLGSNSDEASAILAGMEQDTSSAADNAITIDKNKDEPVLPSNKDDGSSTEEEEKDVTLDDIKDKVDGAGDYIGGVAGDLGDDTIQDIINGDISEDDWNNIGQVGGNVAGDANSALEDRIAELEKKREEEKAAQDKKDRETAQAYDNLNGNLNSLRRGLHDLNEILAESMGQMAVDMTAVNSHFYKVSTLFANLISGDIISYSDISMLDTEETTIGKVSACENYGTIEGESNIGGIAGNMGIEVSMDMEGNLTDRLSNIKLVRNSYEERCVARSCVNHGAINGKKTDIGGIIGYQEIGAVISCEGYGPVGDTGDTYVGGVVGYSKAYIAGCSAMCDISGKEYVGGIAGYGYKITDCSSLINLMNSSAASCGAVAGWADTGLYESVTDKKGNETDRLYYVANNVFVHDTLGGIDNLSYENAACPVTYETLVTMDNAPEELRRMELTYMAEGEVVAVVPFMYGTALDTSLIPEVPAKEGFSGYWPEYDYSMLYFSDTLEATYVSNQSSLASDLTREDSKMSTILLEGSFSDRAALSVEPYSLGIPLLPSRGFKVLETWQICITGNHLENSGYTVRYLPPKAAPLTSTGIYVLGEDGTWNLVQTKEKGSYLTFAGADDSLVFAYYEAKDLTPVYIAASIAAIVVVLVVLLLLRSRKKASPAPAEAGPAVAEPEHSPDEQPAESEQPINSANETVAEPAEEKPADENSAPETEPASAESDSIEAPAEETSTEAVEEENTAEAE